MTNKLIGVIKSITGKTIKTKFFYVGSHGAQDVTEDVCNAIEKSNKVAEQVVKDGGYQLRIPYEYKKGLAVYSFGCGLTHYLQQKELKNLHQYIEFFPIGKCSLEVFTPDDVKQFFKIGVEDYEMAGKLFEYTHRNK